VPDAGGGERAGRKRAAAGLGIARHRPEQEANESARRAVRERAMPRHALTPTEEARAEHVIRASARDRFEHALELGRVVLAVTVDVHRCRIPLVASYLQSRAQGGAESSWLPRLHARSVVAADCGRGVAGAVVHEQDVHPQPACARRDAAKDAAHDGLLVARHDDR
jgi:hypothetical protein